MMKNVKNPFKKMGPTPHEARAVPGDIDRFAQFTADDQKKVDTDLKGSKMGVGLRKQPNFSK